MSMQSSSESSKPDRRDYVISSKGIVAYSAHEWKLESLLTREPADDEFLVELIATGVCHTDITGYGSKYFQLCF